MSAAGDALILGINLMHPDASAAIVRGGRVLFAIAEERLNRKKHYAGIPVLAIRACLDAVGARPSDLAHVAIGRDPGANRLEKVRYALTHPATFGTYVRLARRTGKLGDVRSLLGEAFSEDPARLRFREHHVEHHVAHVASAFYGSGWEEAAGLSYDGSGDFVTTLMAHCVDREIRVLRKVFVPDSLGSFYTMVCEFIGYGRYGDEGKVMGLAPYGSDALCGKLAAAVQVGDGTFRLDPSFFLPFASHLQIVDDAVTRRRRCGPRMTELFGPPRQEGAEITDRDRDLAFAVQHRFEEVARALAAWLHARVPVGRLAMAGGAALNSVTNGKLVAEGPFVESSVHPAAGDDGLAVGAALYVYHAVLGGPREHRLEHAYLGPEYPEEEVRRCLDAAGLAYARLHREALLDRVAARLAEGLVVGWFQGRMEWGPRALGNRSILGHPGHPRMKEILNARIKNREPFRPFAPSILADRQAEYFEHAHASPFMMHVFKVRPEKRQELCAVNHADDTGRLQSVTREENPLYYDLISAFARVTGTPVVLNTSFNENEPIVCRPEEAIDCFRRTRMDVLGIGPFLVEKGPPAEG